MLGGAGSDMLEGRHGDDILHGDKFLNVRISVRANPDGTGGELFSVGSMSQLIPLMQTSINPGQLVIVREIKDTTGFNFDTAMFSDVRANYVVTTVGGITTVEHRVVDVLGNLVAGVDGTDTLNAIERLQFSDQSLVLVNGLNAGPVGSAVILDAQSNVVDSTPLWVSC